MTALSSDVLDEIKALPARYPQPRSAVMPALDLAQEELGYLTPEAMTEVATALNLDAGYVEGVATFYTLFHLEPIGKHRFYVCTNLSCALRGANKIVDHLKPAIGVKDAGELSADGLFSYEAVECLGACEFAPMLRLDHEYHYDLTPEKIDRLVASRRSPAASPASAPHPDPLPDGERGPAKPKRAPAAASPASAPLPDPLPDGERGPAKPKRAPAAASPASAPLPDPLPDGEREQAKPKRVPRKKKSG